MSITIDLPPPLDAQLDQEAKREGISAEERATFLIVLATALFKEDKTTPFQDAVKTFLSHHSLDADHVASVFEELIRVCAAHHDEGKTSAAFQEALKHTTKPGNHEIDFVSLRQWRSALVHGVDVSAKAVFSDYAPAETLLQNAGRLNRQAQGDAGVAMPGPDAPHAQADENAAAIALLQSWLQEDATDDAEEIRKAQQELDEFKQAINTERDRAGARRIYP